MALFAMGTVNKCHAPIHGAHAIFPSQYPQNGNYSSQGVTTQTSSVHIPRQWWWYREKYFHPNPYLQDLKSIFKLDLSRAPIGPGPEPGSRAHFKIGPGPGALWVPPVPCPGEGGLAGTGGRLDPPVLGSTKAKIGHGPTCISWLP